MIDDLKSFFTYNFDIQTANLDLFNKQITYKFNINVILNLKDYKL